jgi:membrane fusion protein (multidrug efflux system)
MWMNDFVYAELKMRKIIYWIAISAVIALTFVIGFVSRGTKVKEAVGKVPVEVNTVTIGSIEAMVELTGWINANSVVAIKSKVPGRVESLQAVFSDGNSVALEEGVEVRKGQSLAVIDHDVYAIEVDRTAAAVAAAEAGLQTANVELNDAEREFKRMAALFEGGSTTAQSRDKAQTAAQMAAAKIKLMESQLRQAKAAMELAGINLRESTIVSPVSGVITKKHIDLGNLVTVGEPIVTIADVNTVKVVVGLADRYAGAVKAGMPVRIKVDAFENRRFEAEIYSVYPAVDEQSRTVQIEIRIDNSDLLLKPGMFARVTLVMQRKDDAVIIRRDAVLGGKIDEPYVYVVENGIAHKHIVKIGIKQGDKYEITDGLKAGRSLVVNGMQFLADGIAVEVVRIEDIK